VGKGISALSLDDEYIAERQKYKSKQAKHVVDGIGQGFIGLGRGIFDGVTGIISQPIIGAQKGGVTGFFQGVGRGVIGVAVKPVTGVLDLASKTTEGIRNTTKIFDHKVTRMRTPRHFGADGSLGEFSQEEAEGGYYLIHAGDGKYQNDIYRYHLKYQDAEANKPTVAILTNFRIIVVNPQKDEMLFAIHYSNIEKVDLITSGIKIFTGSRTNIDQPATDINKPQKVDAVQAARTILCADRNALLVLYTKLKACINSMPESQIK